MSVPEVRFDAVELHLSANPDLPRRFGKRIRDAGGEYAESRGGATTRVVDLPWSARDLVDELVREYPQVGRKTPLIARKIHAAGVPAERVHAVAGTSRHIVHNWSNAGEVAPSAFLESSFARSMREIDWHAVAARWSKEDEQERARRRKFELRTSLEDLRGKIALEAVRILDGANDIEALKDLARAYREVCKEAGIDLIPEAEASPAP